MDITQDLYGLLGVEATASISEIIKAYHKKASNCHPDKNPDNPRAIELFQELSKALEILMDKTSRAAYDQAIAARKQAKERVRQFDAKRKRFKEDLEAHEEFYKRLVDSTPKTKYDDEQLEEKMVFTRERFLVGKRPVAAGPLAAGPVATRAVATRAVAAGPFAAGPVTARAVAAGPFAAGPVAARAVASGPFTAGPFANEDERIRRPRGRAAGIRRQEARFRRFMYQLSAAYYHWARRDGYRRN